MMVLHQSTTATATTANDVSPDSTRSSGSRNDMKRAPIRKRRSKGTIAGYASKAAQNALLSSADAGGNNGDSIGKNKSSQSIVPNTTSPGQNTSDPSPTPAKPCHASRLVSLCTHNALRMGARTQLSLCPPGRVRRELQAKLRQQAKSQYTSSGRKYAGPLDRNGYYSLENMVGEATLESYDVEDEEVLISANTFTDDDEDASSGDEDELKFTISTMLEESHIIDADQAYVEIQEPLYTPAGADSNASNPNGAPLSGNGANSSSKLPFNRRKLSYFDSITAADTTTARAYLKNEFRRSKQRSGVLLAHHLKKMRLEEVRRHKAENGEVFDDSDDMERLIIEERRLNEEGVSRIDAPMTPSLAAALLLESLRVNRLESIEGMSKCYDGIIAAGVALIDSVSIDPTCPTSPQEKARPTRSKILSALAPLLVTSLEQQSGEVILALAKLRKMCGTLRYQRRFVQRIVPCLIRPPNGSMWCLKHQNDMEAILAASELIFDSAFDIFSKGWYERGQLLLADSMRAETLNAAANQLKSLSSEPSDGLALGLSSGPRRRLLTTSKNKKDTGQGNDSLAEWEVIAVDQQIRVSIKNLFTSDWSRTNLQPESVKSLVRRQSVVVKRSSSISVGSGGGEGTAKSVPSSPLSPTRPSMLKSPLSSPHVPAYSSTLSPTYGVEHGDSTAAGITYTSPTGPVGDRPHSPPPSSTLSASVDSNTFMDNTADSSVKGVYDASSAHPIYTPPRSPRSPKKSMMIDTVKGNETPPLSSAQVSPVKKVGGRDASTNSVASVTNSSTPVSPLSVGPSNDAATYKSSGTASGMANSAPVSLPTAHYRALTSTAAERKRTVAACRALRAQIQRFEDAFVQLHGRTPKGLTERAPLATTYAQYREWKRAIRADAACRIQALFRGARTRWALLRSNNADMTRVVMKAAGRPGQKRIDLNLPNDIGSVPQDKLSSSTMLAGSSSGVSLNASSPPLAPQWNSNRNRSRTGSAGQLASDEFSTVSASSQSSSVIGLNTDMSAMSLSELQMAKRDLKQQLKQYDMNFARQHRRMPVKAEKEPIRHLYESYNSLKQQISSLEKDGRTSPSSVSTSSVSTFSRVRPSGTSDSASTINETGSVGTANSASSRAGGQRRVNRTSSPPVASNTQPPVTAPSSTPQDLTALKAEKSQLHQMLRSYERGFYREHRRQVSSFADIRPVAAQYRRYKEIKKAIAALQPS